MFGITGPLLYVLVFCGKMIEVTFSTLRITFSGKGKKFIAAFFGIFENGIWVLLASSVLDDVTSDPMKLVAYCAAFSCGIILGTSVEQKLAVGLTAIQIVIPGTEAVELGKIMREHGFGVTILEGHSVDGTERSLLLIQLRRKLVSQAVQIAKEAEPNAVISVSDVKSVSGGFFK